MNAATANLINALLLIGLGLWGYFGANTAEPTPSDPSADVQTADADQQATNDGEEAASKGPSKTALIPVGFGIVLALMYAGIRNHNKTVAHIAVMLTLVILVALFMPLKGAIGRGDNMATVRVAVMMLSSAFAMFFFVKSFIDARKAREAAE